MRRLGKHIVAGVAAILVGLGAPAAAVASPAAATAPSIVTETGTLARGGRYLIEVPDS